MESDDKLNPKLHSASGEQYAVVLPCSREDFGSFVSGLLGKPQTIEKVFFGVFEISSADVENTFHLVDQRIRQQNEANLLQFTVRVVYDDGSSVLLGNLQDFLHYREVRAIASTGLHLSWVYLIRYQDKKYPEKQQIDMSIIAEEAGPPTMEYFHEATPFLLRRLAIGNIRIRISHTARTWGTDIESLLTGHVATWLRKESRFKAFVLRHDAGIGLSVGVVVLLAALVCSFNVVTRFGAAQVAAATPIIKSPPEFGTSSTGHGITH